MEPTPRISPPFFEYKVHAVHGVQDFRILNGIINYLNSLTVILQYTEGLLKIVIYAIFLFF